MASYSPIGAGEIDPESPITSSLMVRLRDNPLAIQEGDPSAPKVAFNALAAFPGLKAQRGYVQIPGGFIIQWGLDNGNNRDRQGGLTVSYPIAFPNAALQVVAGMNSVLPGVDAASPVISTISRTNFNLGYQATGDWQINQLMFWLAVGH